MVDETYDAPDVGPASGGNLGCADVLCDDAHGLDVFWLLKWHMVKAGPDRMTAASVLMMEMLAKQYDQNEDTEDSEMGCHFQNAVDAFIQQAVAGHYHPNVEIPGFTVSPPHTHEATPAFTQDDLKMFSEMLFGPETDTDEKEGNA